MEAALWNLRKCRVLEEAVRHAAEQLRKEPNPNVFCGPISSKATAESCAVKVMTEHTSLHLLSQERLKRMGLADASPSEEQLVLVGVEFIEYAIRNERSYQLVIVDLPFRSPFNIEHSLSKLVGTQIKINHRRRGSNLGIPPDLKEAPNPIVHRQQSSLQQHLTCFGKRSKQLRR